MENPHFSHEFSLRLQLFCHAIGDFLRRKGPLTLLSEMPGNIGDHLIWAGTEAMLRDANLDYGRITVGDLRNCSGERRQGSLVIPGSGAFTSRWHEWLPGLVMLASDVFDDVIILPSQFDTGVGIVRDCLSRPNVHAFARDMHSYDSVKLLGKASIAPDPALWTLKSLSSPGSAPAENRERLICLRTDAGSLLSTHGLRPAPHNKDISLTSSSLAEFLAEVRNVTEVVSDRLHVVVASLLMGKKVVYVDPYDEKISRYLQYNFGFSRGPLLSKENEAWLAEKGYAEVGS